MRALRIESNIINYKCPEKYKNPRNMKPVVSYWKSGDPCAELRTLRAKLTEINVIRTKILSDDFVQFCLDNKHRVFLHVIVNGMGKTMFEPKIPSVRDTFFQLKKLIDNGFRQQQILVVVDPILPNENGLKALELLLRVFTEFQPLRLRFIRFSVLKYTRIGDKFIIGNPNIDKRHSTKGIIGYLMNTPKFWSDYYRLIDRYKSIITVDSGDEALIGIRELMAFGMNNSWYNPETKEYEKIIPYTNGNKFKPVVNIISSKKPVRCHRKCLLCPYLF